MRTWAIAAAAAATLGWSAAASAQEVSEQRIRAAIDDAARGLGQAVAGGSPLIAPAGTTGGLGRFLVSVGMSVTRVDIEDPQRPSGTTDFLLPTAGISAAVGILDGIDSGGAIGGLGSVDVMGRVGLITARDEIEDSEKRYMVGARLGLLRESGILPAVSLSLARSWTDEIAYGEADDVSFRGEVAVTSVRAEIAKRFLLVAPYAGAGIDRTRIEASYSIPASLSTSGQEIRGSIEPSSSHHTVYGGLDLSLLALTASVEAGVYDGGGYAAVAVRTGL
ncbi:MAG TPA: hypothetical protein VMR66_06230 [Gemmatimonadota bacterium]|nr:hypothetical protein [Gemmatimonadota bacterium]